MKYFQNEAPLNIFYQINSSKKIYLHWYMSITVNTKNYTKKYKTTKTNRYSIFHSVGGSAVTCKKYFGKVEKWSNFIRKQSITQNQKADKIANSRT